LREPRGRLRDPVPLHGLLERGGEVRHSLADVERMESVLGFRPPVDLRRGLELAAGWYRGSLPGAKKAKRGK
ncbi:MAG: hypothetical protein HUU26_06620, partial [Gemmatimonadaceae bacterium]|nr:hypothetical protein [Gemmatimonadaceae bacterium]